jgi:hypothetical protein
VDRTFTAYLDSLRILWYRRIVNFDQKQQREMASWLREHSRIARIWLRNWARTLYLDLREMVLAPWKLNHWLSLLRNLLIAVLAWVLARRALRLLLLLRRGHRRRLEPTRARAGLWLTRIEQSPDPADAALAASVEALRTLRYGPHGLWPSHPKAVFANTRKALRRSRREARRRRTGEPRAPGR